MATTTGLVHKVTLFGDTAASCVFIGPSPSSVEVFLIQLQVSDTDAVQTMKSAMITLIVKAEQAGYPVIVGHQVDSVEIEWVSVAGFNISPIGLAVHDDFYSVSGNGIPSDAVIVFDSAAVTVTVTPDLVRPHCVFVAQLPSSIPVGRNMVQLQAPGWSSDAVPIDVIDSPQTTVRTLYSGSPKTSPYTIVFVANPAMLGTDGTISPDPVLGNRQGFHRAVAICLKDLFAITEDVLYQGNLDANFRLVAIFDPALAANDASALAKETGRAAFEPRRDKLSTFLFGYSEVADVVFVLYFTEEVSNAWSWGTTDDDSRPNTPYTYVVSTMDVPSTATDGSPLVHGHFPSIPGSVLMPLFLLEVVTPVALHEFGHAASDLNNGFVGDLYDNYHDVFTVFTVNKIWRERATDPVPANFASYNGITYASDPNRNSFGGYPPLWTLYHPQLIDPTYPNIMDQFRDKSQFDRLTYRWLTDRIMAKLLR